MEHLQPSAAKTLAWTDDERLDFVARPRWIPHPRAEYALGKLEQLYRHPTSSRMPCLLLVGETNSGKTVILERFTSAHPEEEASDGRTLHPVLLVEAPLKADEQTFHINVLKALRIPYPTQENVVNRRDRVLHFLREMKVRVLVIDEVHLVLAGPQRAHHHFLDLLRSFTNRLKIPLVGAGIPSAYNAVRQDGQLANRFRTLTLPQWTLNDDFLRLLASYERLLPLRRPSGLVEESLSNRLWQLCGGSLGELDGILAAATADAIRTGKERITVTLLKQLDYLWLSENNKQPIL